MEFTACFNCLLLILTMVKVLQETQPSRQQGYRCARSGVVEGDPWVCPSHEASYQYSLTDPNGVRPHSQKLRTYGMGQPRSTLVISTHPQYDAWPLPYHQSCRTLHWTLTLPNLSDVPACYKPFMVL